MLTRTQILELVASNFVVIGSTIGSVIMEINIDDLEKATALIVNLVQISSGVGATILAYFTIKKFIRSNATGRGTDRRDP